MIFNTTQPRIHGIADAQYPVQCPFHAHTHYTYTTAPLHPVYGTFRLFIIVRIVYRMTEWPPIELFSNVCFCVYGERERESKRLRYVCHIILRTTIGFFLFAFKLNISFVFTATQAIRYLYRAHIVQAPADRVSISFRCICLAAGLS